MAKKKPKSKDQSGLLKQYKSAPELLSYHTKKSKELKSKEQGENSPESIKEIMQVSYDYQQKGHAYFLSNNFEEAIDCYQKAIKLNPKNAEYHNNLGNAYFRINDFEEAIDCYQEAIKLDSKNAEYHNSLGDAYFHNNNFLKAINCYQEAIKLDSKNPEYHNNLGNAYFRINNFEKAIDFYQEAIRLDPEYDRAYYELGKVQYKVGQVKEAMDNFASVIDKNPVYCSDNIITFLKDIGFSPKDMKLICGIILKIIQSNELLMTSKSKNVSELEQLSLKNQKSTIIDSDADKSYKLQLEKAYSELKMINLNIAEAYLAYRIFDPSEDIQKISQKAAVHYFKAGGQPNLEKVLSISQYCDPSFISQINYKLGDLVLSKADTSNLGLIAFNDMCYKAVKLFQDSLEIGNKKQEKVIVDAYLQIAWGYNRLLCDIEEDEQPIRFSNHPDISKVEQSTEVIKHTKQAAEYFPALYQKLLEGVSSKILPPLVNIVFSYYTGMDNYSDHYTKNHKSMEELLGDIPEISVFVD